MRILQNRNLLILILCVFSITTYSQNFDKTFDQWMKSAFPADQPGASALVAKNGKIIYHKAFGMADMELDVSLKPNHVFEIGSITKQFTAVSILMLVEKGKLKLDDDITKFIKDYPTHGYKITIHDLLTHTSGIKSYTSMEKWRPEWRKDFKPLELINFFKNEPMDFAPGSQYKYNNSAYFILGHVIELTSGKTYAEYIEEYIFKPLEMSSSYYGSQTQIIKNRASGYQKQNKLRNAEYLSLTQPYAAGSIMSTVEDLYKWNRAIRSHKLISKESTDKAWTNYELTNGKKIDYGYGWALGNLQGSRTIDHGGGIFGFVTSSIYLPDEDVFVAIFCNCDCSNPDQISSRMAAMASGKSDFLSMVDTISSAGLNMKQWIGVYDFSDNATRIITYENGQLFSQRDGGSKFRIYPVKEGSFVFDGDNSMISFTKEGDKIKAKFSSIRSSVDGVKSTKEIPALKEIPLAPEIMQRYVGVYELSPSFHISVTMEEGKLMTQATGQAKFQIFPSSETMFFVKVVDAKVEFIKSDMGLYDSFILYQGGQKIPGKKKKD